ncbi:hypothetical protein B0H14DRAFT_2602843 [Mycena olivaceomarginata]|nr:hypothetical protein B0H14DRAFT_2602843 [Mycena olivaceomarginata]
MQTKLGRGPPHEKDDNMASDTWNTHEELTAALGRAGNRTTWKEVQNSCTAQGPGPSAQEAAHIRERMMQRQDKGKHMLQPTMEEVLARTRSSAQQPTPDPRTHPSRVAQIQHANNPTPTVSSTQGVPAKEISYIGSKK